MSGKQSQYEIGLDKTPANYVPLTPLSFLARSAAVEASPFATLAVSSVELLSTTTTSNEPSVTSWAVSACRSDGRRRAPL